MAFKLKIKPTTGADPGAAPASADAFAAGAALVQSQTGPRPEKPVRLNLDLDPATHRRLKIAAIDRGISVAVLVRQAIEREIN